MSRLPPLGSSAQPGASVAMSAGRNATACAHMTDELPRAKRLLAKLARFDGAYLRFSGPMTVTVFRAGELVEEFTDEAIRELMHFGHAALTPGTSGRPA